MSSRFKHSFFIKTYRSQPTMIQHETALHQILKPQEVLNVEADTRSRSAFGIHRAIGIFQGESRAHASSLP